MRIEKFRVRFQGITPLLMDKLPDDFSEATSDKIRTVTQITDKTPRELAEKTAYRLPDGRLYIPSEWIERGFMETCSNYKQRGSRKSLKYVALGSFEIVEENIPLIGGIKDFEVFTKPVLNQKTQGRIAKHRARIEQWGVDFEVSLDVDVIQASDAKKILEEAGIKNGMGSWRPQKRGRFGKFQVVIFEPIGVKPSDITHHATGRVLNDALDPEKVRIDELPSNDRKAVPSKK
jgi:hypothetical protein